MFVDTSVWIDHLRDSADLTHVKLLRAAFGRDTIVVGDIVLMEVLQGTKNEKAANKIERLLREFSVVDMLDAGLAVRAARNYRTLRNYGVTVRKLADMIIGTYCIEHGLPLLHADRDFDGMEKHLGLICIS